ncbi:MAG: MerR family transcriptional regulator [Alphaproteobacteria bacterium]|nr:MAG: MerR family transcriptional regulator [Alphaproteobacteria bacterium]
MVNRTNRTISQAAREAGVGVETVRFYERKGLIAQPRKPQGGGYRIYSRAVVERIRFVRKAQQLGFSLREIDTLLALRADPNAACEDVRRQAAAKLEQVEEKMAELGKIRSALKALISNCPRKGPAAGRCTILEVLGVGGKEDAVE